MFNEISFYNTEFTYFENNKVAFRERIFKAKKDTIANLPPMYPLDENEFWIIDTDSNFKIGDRISHYSYGEGVILGNYHKRIDAKYYWHIQYDNGTYGYNQAGSLKLVETLNL
jgi:hypothetical protein